jgi:fucose 4-O-acetylase-like acetyltransferase
MTDKRLWWVDWSKSICIFLMVVGHSFYPEKGSIDWMTKNLIYSFHMPLFFFVSGYLTKYKDEKFIQFLKRQVKSLLIPYVFFNVVCFIIGLPISKFAIDNNRVIDTFIGGGHSFAGATWFLLSLFWIKILNHFVVQLGGGANL